MLNTFFIRNKSIFSLWAAFALLLVAIWVVGVNVAEAEHASGEGVVVGKLSIPASVAAAEADDETAFREEDAGISAYIRVGSGSDPRLDINKIVDALTSVPESAAIRGEGALVDMGLNFGIVDLPMRSAVIGGAPDENVSVYFDHDGWIVAYLPHDRPAAALWKHGSAAGATADDPKADETLERNLLVLAIREVMLAQDPNSRDIKPSEVTYYDWMCPQCDAFVLFSGVSKAGTPDEIKFVVPYTISLVQASAAVALTEQVDGGDSVRASLAVDGDVIASAGAGDLLDSANFDLARDSESTSLHRVVIEGPSNNIAAGAILLMYDRP